MQSTTSYVDDKKFETVLGRHRIITDQPIEGGGTDAGPTPPELLLASLSSCAGHYAAEYLRARSLPSTGLKVMCSAEKTGRPVRLDSFRIGVEVPGILQENHREGLLRAVKACLIHNTLLATPGIEIAIVDALSPSPAGTPRPPVAEAA